MPLISERTTDAGARGKSLPREENRSRREETGARKLISNSRGRMIIPHLLARSLFFVGRRAGLIVTSNVIGYSPFPEVSIGRLL